MVSTSKLNELMVVFALLTLKLSRTGPHLGTMSQSSVVLNDMIGEARDKERVFK